MAGLVGSISVGTFCGVAVDVSEVGGATTGAEADTTLAAEAGCWFTVGAAVDVSEVGGGTTGAEADATLAVEAGCWFTDGTGGAGGPGTRLGFVGNIDGIMPPITFVGICGGILPVGVCV